MTSTFLSWLARLIVFNCFVCVVESVFGQTKSCARTNQIKFEEMSLPLMPDVSIRTWKMSLQLLPFVVDNWK